MRDAALTGGEDYELVLAVAPALLPAALAAAAKARTPVSVIGRLCADAGAGGRAGALIAVDVRGHDHLRTPTALDLPQARLGSPRAPSRRGGTA